MGSCLQSSIPSSTQSATRSSINQSQSQQVLKPDYHEQNKEYLNEYFLLISGYNRHLCNDINKPSLINLILINKTVFYYYFLRNWSCNKHERHKKPLGYPLLMSRNGISIDFKDKNGNWRSGHRRGGANGKDGKAVIFGNLPINIQNYILSKNKNIINIIAINWINHIKIIPNDIIDIISAFYGNIQQNKLYISIQLYWIPGTSSTNQWFYFDPLLFSQHIFEETHSFFKHITGNKSNDLNMKIDENDNNNQIINYNARICDCIYPDQCSVFKHVFSVPYRNYGRAMYGSPISKGVVSITSSRSGSAVSLFRAMLQCLFNTRPFIEYVSNYNQLHTEIIQELKLMLSLLTSNEFQMIDSRKLLQLSGLYHSRRRDYDYISWEIGYMLNALFPNNSQIFDIFKINSSKEMNNFYKNRQNSKESNIMSLNYEFKDMFSMDLILDIYDGRSGNNNGKCNRHFFKITDTSTQFDGLQTKISEIYIVSNIHNIYLFSGVVFGEDCSGYRLDNIEYKYRYCHPIGYFNKSRYPQQMNLCFIMDNNEDSIQSTIKHCTSLSANSEFGCFDVQYIGISIMLSIPIAMINNCYEIHRVIYKRLYHWFQHKNNTKFNINLIKPPNDDNDINEWRNILDNLPYILRKTGRIWGNIKSFDDYLHIIPNGMDDTFWDPHNPPRNKRKYRVKLSLTNLMIEWNDKNISDIVQKLMITNINYSKEFLDYSNKCNITKYNDSDYTDNIHNHAILNADNNYNENKEYFDIVIEKTIKSAVIQRLPEIFMISINRQNTRLNTSKRYKYISNKKVKYVIDNLVVMDNKNNKCNYCLYSILCVSGYGNGMFYSVCKNMYNNKWYRFDDSNIKQLTLKEVESQNESVYVLFYQKERY